MEDVYWQQLLHRTKDANKYDFGHVLVIGGSVEMAGAPVLAARAALRIGAGLATIASTADAVQIIDRDIEEVMTLILPGWDKISDCQLSVQNFVDEKKVTAAVIGPGLPAGASAVARELLKSLRIPVVADAVSFTALSGHLDTLKQASAANPNLVLTPHPGEFARMTLQPILDASAERDQLVQFAKEYQVTLAMKHSHTLVVSRAGEVHENTTGNTGLATAGSGDVLAGILAGMLAQQIEPFTAAKMAVYIHGLAADIASQEKTEPGLIASDIIEFLPAALHKIEDQEPNEQL